MKTTKDSKPDKELPGEEEEKSPDTEVEAAKTDDGPPSETDREVLISVKIHDL